MNKERKLSLQDLPPGAERYMGAMTLGWLYISAIILLKVDGKFNEREWRSLDREVNADRVEGRELSLAEKEQDALMTVQATRRRLLNSVAQGRVLEGELNRLIFAVGASVYRDPFLKREARKIGLGENRRAAIVVDMLEGAHNYIFEPQEQERQG